MGVIRKTRSVNALLNEFEQSTTALSTLELVERLSDQMNRSTVYRILERLENGGVLHSFLGRDGLAWYALSDQKISAYSQQKSTHPHFQCVDCGKTECLPINIPIPELTERRVESVSFLLVGRCADCVNA